MTKKQLLKETNIWVHPIEVSQALQFGSDPKKLIKFFLDRNLIKPCNTLSGYESMNKKIKFIENSSIPLKRIDRMLVRIDIIPFLLLEKDKEVEEYLDQEGLYHQFDLETEEYNKKIEQVESLRLSIKADYDNRIERLVHQGLKM